MKRSRLKLLGRDIVDFLAVAPWIIEIQTRDSRQRARKSLEKAYIRGLDLTLSLYSKKQPEIEQKSTKRGYPNMNNTYPCT
tara:strand:+ start:2491 stop:2733 length:243 start_codon:yes stop_codon:yes gene_type:complete